MSKFLSITITTVIAFIAMVMASTLANAQGFQRNPLIDETLKKSSALEEGNVVQIRGGRGGRSRSYNRGGRNRSYNRGGRNRGYNRGGRNRNYYRGGRNRSYNRGARRYGNYRGGRRYNNYRGGRRYGYGRPYGYRRPYRGGYYNYGYFPGLAIGLGVAGAIGYNNYYNNDHYYEDSGGSHVDWCLNRYRSYKPRTDTFRGYDGKNHRCRSPYRR